MVRVKICGMQTREDAQSAVAAGADALGFIFAESKRRITPEQAREIIAELPPFVTPVGVFLNESHARIQEIVNYCCLRAIQLHGEESPDECRGWPICVIKSFRMHNQMDLSKLSAYREVDALLLDTYMPGRTGGTGQNFDWKLAEKLATSRPIILAGGLNTVNVATAIRQVQPYAVDVASGVEENGQKSPRQMSAFVRAAKGV